MSIGLALRCAIQNARKFTLFEIGWRKRRAGLVLFWVSISNCTSRCSFSATATASQTLDPPQFQSRVPRKERKAKGPRRLFSSERDVHRTLIAALFLCSAGAPPRSSRTGACVKCAIAGRPALGNHSSARPGARRRSGFGVPEETETIPGAMRGNLSEGGDSFEATVALDPRALPKRSATSFQPARAARLAWLAAPTPLPPFPRAQTQEEDGGGGRAAPSRRR